MTDRKPKSTAERNRELAARKRAMGWVRVDVMAPPAMAEKIKTAVRAAWAAQKREPG